jgi:hypothetical protein
MGFDRGAPGAEEKPQDRYREPGNALGAEGGEDAEGGDERQCEEDEAGAGPDPVSGGDACGKEPGGMEEGDGG